jgi:3-hydroxyisobutyrate dehydrogenase
MAERIISAGFELVVWARRPASLELLESLGATTSSDPAGLARIVDLVCVCVLSDDDIEEVCGGDSGVLAGLRAGTTLAIHSTVHPSTVRDVADRAAALGAAVLDAPVSGGALAAAAGRLVTMVGGDPEVLDRCREVFAAHSDRVFHVGEVGAA